MPPGVAVVTFFSILPILRILPILPILRSTVVDLNGVYPSVVESARGIGMGRLRTFLTAKLPLVRRVILGGIRVCAQRVGSNAAVAATVLEPRARRVRLFRALPAERRQFPRVDTRWRVWQGHHRRGHHWRGHLWRGHHRPLSAASRSRSMGLPNARRVGRTRPWTTSSSRFRPSRLRCPSAAASSRRGILPWREAQLRYRPDLPSPSAPVFADQDALATLRPERPDTPHPTHGS